MSPRPDRSHGVISDRSLAGVPTTNSRGRRYTHGGSALTCTSSAVNERLLIAEGLLSLVAERLAVLGQVVRLRLVEQLADGPATPQELVDALGLTQQNVSNHLQILYRAGVVSPRPDGTNVFYSLRDESTVRLLEDVVASVTERLRELSALASGATNEEAAGTTNQASRRRRGEVSGR
jgi:DNA-binding transcriptional ArsR family regulator